MGKFLFVHFLSLPDKDALTKLWPKQTLEPSLHACYFHILCVPLTFLYLRRGENQKSQKRRVRKLESEDSSQSQREHLVLYKVYRKSSSTTHVYLSFQ